VFSAKRRKVRDCGWCAGRETDREDLPSRLEPYPEKKDDEALKLMHSAADLEDTTDKHPSHLDPLCRRARCWADLLFELRQPAEAQFERSLHAAPIVSEDCWGLPGRQRFRGMRKRLERYKRSLPRIALWLMVDAMGSGRRKQVFIE